MENFPGIITFRLLIIVLIAVFVSIAIGHIKRIPIKLGLGIILTLVMWGFLMGTVVTSSYNFGKTGALNTYQGKPILLERNNAVNRIFNPVGVMSIGDKLFFYEPNGKMYDLSGIKYADGLTPQGMGADAPTASYIIFDRGGSLHVGRNNTDKVTTFHPVSR